MGNPRPRTGGFKPHGIGPPAIISMIVVSLALAAVIEYLAQKSQRQGGLSLVETADDLSPATTFGYLYAPTVISVIYGLTWAWVDLDARRMQPWIELSRPEGATARYSLLLDYPFGFLAFVPIQAWKRKHWPVFFSGTALVLIFWGITPLQSAIFGTSSVEITETVAAKPPSTLVPVEEQAVALDSSILTESYAVSWLDQGFPPFTTADYVVFPVSAADETEPLPNELWTVKTTKLTTELNCWPAKVTIDPIYYPSLHATYDNGRGCSNNITLSTEKDSASVLYIGWKDDANLGRSLEDPNCNADAANQFLAIWAAQARDSSGTVNDTRYDFTASFCETSYLKQDVSVTIARNESRPVEVVTLGPTKTLDNTEFNSTAFEFFLNVGLPPVTKTRDQPASVTLEAFPTLEGLGVKWPSTNMVIYALGLLGKPASALRDRTVLHEAFAVAHRALFSISIPHLLSPTGGPASPDSNIRDGVRKHTMYGVVISRPISAVVEALLLLVALLASSLLVTAWRSPCKLSQDPASLGFTLRLLKPSTAVLDRFTDQDSVDDKVLRDRLAGERYALVEDESAPEGLKLEVITGYGQTNPTSSFQQHVSYLPVHPDCLRAFAGAVFVAGLVGGMVILVYFKFKERDLNGLPRPTDNFVVLQILENYIPMVFCTLLEPFLVLLTRLVCVIQPFRDLRQGGSTAGKTIETRYTALPPQLLILHSFKSRHFILAALSALTILAQVLAVGLGGVFNENPVVISYPATFQQRLTTTLSRDTIKVPSFNPIDDLTHFYATFFNYTSNTSLPSWTSPDFAFLPVNFTQEIKSSANESVPTFQVQVRGFGAEPRCVPLPTDPSERPAYANMSQIEFGSFRPSYAYQHPNGSMIKCSEADAGGGRDLNVTDTGVSGRQISARLESRSRPNGPENDGGFCRERFVMGWLRADARDIKGTMKSTIVSCEPVLKTAMFDVNFALDGRVQSYERIGDFEDPTKFMSENMTREFIRQGNYLIANPDKNGAIDSGWTNHTFATNWNYVLKAKLGSDILMDPAKPVPSHEFVIPLVEELYRRSFALVLSLNMPFFTPAPADDPAFLIQGEFLVEETRIFLEDPALYMSLAIMALNIVVLVAVYYRERQPFLPRLPSTLASQIAYVAASRMVRGYGDKIDGDSAGSSWNNLLERDSLDVGGTETEHEPTWAGNRDYRVEQHWAVLAPTSPGMETSPETTTPTTTEKGTTVTAIRDKAGTKTHQLKRQTYSFGRYRGVDGNMHVGIEVDPLVTGIDKTILHKRQSTFSSWLSKEDGGRTPVELPGGDGGGSILKRLFRRRNRKESGNDETRPWNEGGAFVR